MAMLRSGKPETATETMTAAPLGARPYNTLPAIRSGIGYDDTDACVARATSNPTGSMRSPTLRPLDPPDPVLPSPSLSLAVGPDGPGSSLKRSETATSQLAKAGVAYPTSVPMERSGRVASPSAIAKAKAEAENDSRLERATARLERKTLAGRRRSQSVDQQLKVSVASEHSAFRPPDAVSETSASTASSRTPSTAWQPPRHQPPASIVLLRRHDEPDRPGTPASLPSSLEAEAIDLRAFGRATPEPQTVESVASTRIDTPPTPTPVVPRTRARGRAATLSHAKLAALNHGAADGRSPPETRDETPASERSTHDALVTANTFYLPPIAARPIVARARSTTPFGRLAHGSAVNVSAAKPADETKEPRRPTASASVKALFKRQRAAKTGSPSPPVAWKNRIPAAMRADVPVERADTPGKKWREGVLSEALSTSLGQMGGAAMGRSTKGDENVVEGNKEMEAEKRIHTERVVGVSRARAPIPSTMRDAAWLARDSLTQDRPARTPEAPADADSLAALPTTTVAHGRIALPISVRQWPPSPPKRTGPVRSFVRLLSPMPAPRGTHMTPTGGIAHIAPPALAHPPAPACAGTPANSAANRATASLTRSASRVLGTFGRKRAHVNARSLAQAVSSADYARAMVVLPEQAEAGAAPAETDGVPDHTAAKASGGRGGSVLDELARREHEHASRESWVRTWRSGIGRAGLDPQAQGDQDELEGEA
ncbi:hypothetical protein Q5752_003781 [Cryptotrichosporon argae]